MYLFLKNQVEEFPCLKYSGFSLSPSHISNSGNSLHCRYCFYLVFESFIHIYNDFWSYALPLPCSSPDAYNTSLTSLTSSLLESIKSNECCPDDHVCEFIHWAISNLPEATFSKNNNSPSLHTHRLPIAPQPGVGNHKASPPSSWEFWLDQSCAGKHGCHRFMSTVTMSWTEHSISHTSAPSTSSAKFLALSVGGSWFSLPVYDWAFTISYVQHVDQFWVCTNCCHWPALRTAQIYS